MKTKKPSAVSTAIRVCKTQEFNTQDAIKALRIAYLAFKKQLKNAESTRINFNQDEAVVNLTFTNKDITFSLIAQEGGVL